MGLDTNTPSPILTARCATGANVVLIMQRICLALTIALAALSAKAAPAPAGSLATPPPPPWEKSEWDKTVDGIKQPVDWFSWGTDLRVRNEYFHNAQTLDPHAAYNEQDYFRFRGRIWTSITPVKPLSLNVRLTSEPRVWNNDASYSPFRGKSGTDWTYGIFDQLNLQWKSGREHRITLTVGRQDISMGENWLTLEGTPYDGSWTLFMDAARLTYEMQEAQTTFDLVGFAQKAEVDAWIPVINNQERLMTDQDENGFILNIANRSVKGLTAEGYFIYKHDDMVPGGKYGDNADIYTIGSRVSGSATPHLKYYLEAAYQFGHKMDTNVQHPTISTQARDLEAYGANGRLTYLFRDKMNNQLSFQAEYLSGDDPSTYDDEMFDILWGRYPRWSELYNVYSYVPESRVGQTGNLYRFGPSWTFTPTKKLDCSLTYFALFADEAVPTRVANHIPFSQDGNFRGHYFQAWAKYKFNRHLSGHLWAETVLPGNFYTYDDPMTFLRAEIYLTF
jgi:hypothetical protein